MKFLNALFEYYRESRSEMRDFGKFFMLTLFVFGLIAWVVG